MKSEVTEGLDPDMYGQVHPHETPELLLRKLQEFDRILRQRTSHETEDNLGLLRALHKCHELFTASFKIRFMRSVVFNVDEAVKMVERYWNKRIELFGIKAFSEMTQDSLFTEDEYALHLGYLRIHPDALDERGRAVIFLDPSLHDSRQYSRESMCRVIFYMLDTAFRGCESVERHGIVVMVDLSRARLSNWDRKFAAAVLGCLGGIVPGRIAAFNIIRAPGFTTAFLPIVKMFMSEIMRKRIHSYGGSNKSIVRRLEKFGLSRDSLPLEVGGFVEMNHQEWLLQRRNLGY